MKNNPIYQSKKPLAAGQQTGWRMIFMLVIVITTALAGGLLGSGFNVQANTETVPATEVQQLVTPAAADEARELADDVRTTILCLESETGAVCEERAVDPSQMEIP